MKITHTGIMPLTIEVAAFRAQNYWIRWKSSSDGDDVKKRFFLTMVIALAFAALAACGTTPKRRRSRPSSPTVVR